MAGPNELDNGWGYSTKRLVYLRSLVHELKRRDGKLGLIAICEGGGTANAILLERT